MVHIFAGRDEAGRVRYIGEVSAGADCGCFCLVCSARLIAKKGDMNEWHFAHEGGQQRPECLIGARNLVRSVALEHLQTVRRLPLRQPFVRTVRMGNHSQCVALNAEIRNVDWLHETSEASFPVARLTLEKGEADLYLQIEGENLSRKESAERGLLLLRLPMPSNPQTFLTRESLVSYIVQSMRANWIYLPDINGLLESAKQKVEQLNDADRFKLAMWQKQRSQDAGQRWSKIRTEMMNGVQGNSRKIADSSMEVPYIAPAWAKFWKAGTIFYCYFLRDGSRWLLYETEEHGYILRPWIADDGWDEALPRSVGIADEGLGAYRCKDILSASEALRKFMREVLNAISIEHVERIFYELG